MKYFYAFVICIICSYSFAQSQLILTRSNFNINYETDTLISGPTTGVNIAKPTEGPAQSWDYEGVYQGAIATAEYALNKDTKFPNSQLFAPDEFDFITNTRGFYFDDFFEINNDYYALVGQKVKKQDYGIGDLSGNPLDTLSFPEDYYTFDSPSYIVKFPTTYQTVTTTNFTRVSNFTLSLASFGLNKTPGQKKSFYAVTDSVVGWGMLYLSSIDSITGSNSIVGSQALLFKRYSIRTDSVYLGGAPASSLMLGAFGIKQGAVTKDYRYQFMTENNKSFLLRIGYKTDSTFTKPAFYYLYKFITKADVNEDNSSTGFKIYPNPVTDGTINLKISDSDIQRFELSDIFGQRLINENLSPGELVQQILLPEGISPGIYFYKSYNSANQLKLTGKIVVNQ